MPTYIDSKRSFEMSITRRSPQEEIEVLVHSQYRNNPDEDNHSDFTYNLNRPISRVGEIQISSVQVPYSYYAINDNNHTLRLGGGSAGSAIVPNGNYTTGTLTTALKTAMEAILGVTATVTYNSTTNKFTLVHSSVSFFVDSTGATNIAYAIGYETNVAASTTSTSDKVVDISGPKHLVLKSSILTQFTAEKNTTATGLASIYVAETGVSDNILHTIPINAQPTGINLDIPLRTSAIRLNTILTFQNNLDFRLEDDEGNLLDLNGKEWSIRLLFKVR